MADVILVARRLHVSGATPPRVEGFDRTGDAIARAEPVWREEGEIYAMPFLDAQEPLNSRSADLAAAAGPLGALAEAVLSARSAAEAAAAGSQVRGVRVWHGVQTEGHWCPVQETGVGRDVWDSFFRNPQGARAHFAAHPDSGVIFSFLDRHGIRRAVVWRRGSLLPIPTTIFKVNR